MTRLKTIFALIAFHLVGIAPVFAFQSPPGSKGQDPTMTLFLMIGVFLFIFYFIVMRPQQKEQRRHKDRLEALKKGDRVITAGGIHGTVRTPKDKTVILEIAEGVKITVNKSSVSSVLDDGEWKSKPSKGSRETDLSTSE